MTKDEFTQANADIAKFMGYEVISPIMRPDPENWDQDFWELEIEPDILEFNSSEKVLCSVGKEQYRWDWNWIMKVIEKIEQIKIDDRKVFVTMGDDNCTIWLSVFDSDLQNEMKETCNLSEIYQASSRIEAAFLAISDFVQWYRRREVSNG